jgi:hypothetical protein
VSAPLTIAVVGAGVVGGNLVRPLAELGHHVLIGARDPGSEATVALAASAPGVPVVELGRAGREADVIVLAVPAWAVDAAARAALAEREVGAPVILVDATNDVAGAGRSPYERIVDAVGAVPGVAVVKAFNTVGAEAILHPVVDGRPLFLPIAGADGAAETVRELAAAIGFDAIVVGGGEAVPHLEAHARLWIHLAFRCGLGRDFGFTVARRAPA